MAVAVSVGKEIVLRGSIGDIYNLGMKKGEL